MYNFTNSDIRIRLKDVPAALRNIEGKFYKHFPENAGWIWGWQRLLSQSTSMSRADQSGTCKCRVGLGTLHFQLTNYHKRHEDVLHNLGIAGQDFIQRNEPVVVEMTRKFLDYVKSARLEATDSENTIRRDTESERIEIRMTADGYPIIPKLVMEKELKKAEWEKLLRAFLTQHYCKCTLILMCIQSRNNILQI